MFFLYYYYYYFSKHINMLIVFFEREDVDRRQFSRCKIGVSGVPRGPYCMCQLLFLWWKLPQPVNNSTLWPCCRGKNSANLTLTKHFACTTPHHLVFSGVSRQGKKVESYWFNSTGWWRTHFFVDFTLTMEWFSSLSLGTKNTKTEWFMLTRMSFPDKTPFFGF